MVMSDGETLPQDMSQDARPRLARRVRLVRSEAQGGFVVLAPERVFKINPVAAAILQQCDGSKTLAQIVDELATAYNAESGRVLADTVDLLNGLIEKRLVVLT